MASDLITTTRSAAADLRRPSAFLVAARMRLTMIRRSMKDPSTAIWSLLGAAVGLLLAVATLWVAVRYPQLLAPALGLWQLGWIIGPVVIGRGEPLRPTYFTALGLTPGRLAVTLLGGALAGFGPVISLVATASLVVVGFRAGLLPGLVAIPATGLTLLLFVSASKLSTALYGVLVRTPAGAASAGVITGFVLAFAAQGWALVAAFVSRDLGGVLDHLARLLPSGWGLVAIEAVPDAPLRVLAGLLGMLALAILALLAWGWVVGRDAVAAAARVQPRRLLRGHDPDSAARAKESRSVLRDPLQINRLTFALSYGLSFCLMPLAVGWAGMVPWTAPVFVVMAASASANVYGNDGTAVWQVIMTPGAARSDVRARQQTFLALTTPPAVAITLLAVLLVDARGQWPYVVAVLPALLGAGAGLTVLLSVAMPTPTTDPHKRTANPLDTGAEAAAAGTMYLAMFAVLAAATPALLAVRLVGWWGVLVGLLTGLLAWHRCGQGAARRLERFGPELLSLMRHGQSAGGSTGSATTVSVLDTLPTVRRRLVIGCFLFGAIPLFPQGIVPMIFLATHNPARVWFLAMYLPTPVNWIVAIAMTTLGLTMYAYGSVAYATATRRARIRSQHPVP